MTVVLMFLILGVLIALYFYLTRNYNYWLKHGVPCMDGALPGFGHMLSLICMKTNVVDLYCKIYEDNKDHSMIGIYEFTRPSLMILEPKLVKQVLQTNFSSFSENIKVKVDPKVDPLITYHPILLSGEKWLNSRKRLAVAFSNTRLKILLESVKQVCATFEKYINEKMRNVEKEEFELKFLFARYTAQVVAASGFGVDGHCFDDEKKNLFFQKLWQTFEPTTRNKIMFTLSLLIPSFNKILKISFIPKHVAHFFETLVADLMKRTKNGIPRNNIFHMITELERAESEKFNIAMLTGQAMSFVIDSYETSSSAMSFIGFHLASYPEKQEKLRKEVMSVLNRYDGEITYEGLKEMTYMDQVFNESMRMTPVVGFMRRKCTKEFELKGSDGVVCRVQPGMNILISIQALHKDPQYWENPEEYNPERFNPGREHSIEKFTFLPFGEGPRICVGIRMGQLMIKAGLATILKKYKMELSPRMEIPLKLIPGTILSIPQGGQWVYFKHL